MFYNIEAIKIPEIHFLFDKNFDGQKKINK